MAYLAIAILCAAVIAIITIARRRSPGSDEGVHTKRIGDRLRRLAELQERYAVLTPAVIAETPDDALLEAVLANLWAKMKPDLSDAHEVIGGLSSARRQLYALYAVTGGIKQGGFGPLKASEDGALLPDAASMLLALEMPESEAILREAGASDNPDAYDDPYIDAFEAERGKERMIDFIRANAPAFSDLV